MRGSLAPSAAATTMRTMKLNAQAPRRVLLAPPLPPRSSSSISGTPFSSSTRQYATPPPDPTSSSSSSQSSFDSLYSARYQGQGAKQETPPWYKSPALLLLGFMPIFTLGLGVWQVKRLEWKVGLIEELEWKLKKEPMKLPKNINLSVLPSFSYRLVSLSGYFDHSRTLFLGPRVRDGTVGAHIVTPFIRDEGGGEVLVDRGFVADTSIYEDSNGRRMIKSGAEPSSHVTLTALLTPVSPPNAFTPSNDPVRNRWFHADPQAMASHVSSRGEAAVIGPSSPEDHHDDEYTPSAGVAQSVKSMLGVGSGSESSKEHHVLPILLEEVYDGYDSATRLARGVPIGRSATIELRNQHAVYAATWLSLSAATAGMFVLLVRRGR